MFAPSFEAALRGEWGVVTAHMHPSASFTDHRAVVGAGLSAEGRDQTIGFARSVVDMGVEGIDHQVVALRGRLLVLLRATWSGPRGSVDNLIVLEVDGNSLLLRYDIFDDDALDAALAYLDERFLEGEGAAYADSWRVGIDYLAAVSRHDLARMEELSAPEMVVHDHRPASFGQLGREEYLGTYPTLWARRRTFDGCCVVTSTAPRASSSSTSSCSAPMTAVCSSLPSTWWAPRGAVRSCTSTSSAPTTTRPRGPASRSARPRRRRRSGGRWSRTSSASWPST